MVASFLMNENFKFVIKGVYACNYLKTHLNKNKREIKEPYILCFTYYV